MINARNYYFDSIEMKTLKFFGNNISDIIYDSRVKSVFRRLYIEKSKQVNDVKRYFFTDTTIRRTAQMDWSKINHLDLRSIYHKTESPSIGLIYTDMENIHFVYYVDINYISIIAFRGMGKISVCDTNNIKGDWSQKVNDVINFRIVGSLILQYDNDKIECFPNCTIGRVNAKANISSKAFSKEVTKLIKLICEAEQNGATTENSDEIIDWNKISDFSKDLKKEVKDFNLRNNILIHGLNMLIFLKTSNTIDETFIAESNMQSSSRSKNYQNGCDDIIVIDAFWNRNINVINPFSVSGHFRNQPKKNKNGEWYTELIYIDGFMKNSYTRKAKMTNE